MSDVLTYRVGEFQLAEHAYACTHGNAVVFLDLRADKYLAIDAREAASLAACVEGWPVGHSEVDSPGQPCAPIAGGLVQSLLQKGLLSPASTSQGKRSFPRQAQGELIGEGLDEEVELWRGCRYQFLKTVAQIALLLRVRRFQSLIDSIRLQKAQTAPVPGSLDTQEATRRIRAYRYLRPYVFASKDACLFNSLALFHFLQHYGIQTDIVFGVKTNPFYAHCWLQQQATVIADSLDNVQRYTPIMQV